MTEEAPQWSDEVVAFEEDIRALDALVVTHTVPSAATKALRDRLKLALEP